MASTIIFVPIFVGFADGQVGLATSRETINLPLGALLLTVVAVPLGLKLWKVVPRPIVAYAGFFLAWIILAACINLSSTQRALPSFGFYALQQFLPLVGFLLGLQVAASGVARERAVIRSSFLLVVALVALLTILSLPYMLGVAGATDPSRHEILGLTFYSVADYWPAVAFAMSVLNCWWAFKERGLRRGFYVVLAFVFLAYLVGIVGRRNLAVAALVAWAWILALHAKRPSVVAVGLVAVAVLGGILAIDNPVSEKLTEEFLFQIMTGSLLEHSSVSERPSELSVLFETFWEYIPTGFLAFGETGQLGTDESRVGSSQNQYVAVLFRWGIIGFLLFLGHVAFILTVLVTAYRRRAALAHTHAVPLSMALAFVLVINNQFQHFLTNPYTGPVFYFLFALVYVASRTDMPQSQSIQNRNPEQSGRAVAFGAVRDGGRARGEVLVTTKRRGVSA